LPFQFLSPATHIFTATHHHAHTVTSFAATAHTLPSSPKSDIRQAFSFQSLRSQLPTCGTNTRSIHVGLPFPYLLTHFLDHLGND
jgi:hypothetical protein